MDIFATAVSTQGATGPQGASIQGTQGTAIQGGTGAQGASIQGATGPQGTTGPPEIIWSAVTSDGNLAVDTGTLANKATLLTLTLPSTAAVGKVIKICGQGVGGWKIAQNASGQIIFGTNATTVGVGGYVASTNQYDAIGLVCIIANNVWVVVSSIGNITIV